MKKKIIIPIVIAVVLIVGIAVFLLLKNNKAATIITLDINPSIELSLDKEDKIIKVRALNDDAQEIIDDNFKGKDLNETLEIIADNLKEKGYIVDGDVDVVIYSEGNLDVKEVEASVFDSFRKKDINPFVVIVTDITKEDKELSKKHNISPAKAAYINNILKDNDELSLDELLGKPVSELRNMDESGLYCDEGYTLEGDNCLKEIDRKPATDGQVCPEGYYGIFSLCYKEGRTIDTGNLSCREGYTIVDGDCVRTEVQDPIPDEVTCKQGTKTTKAELGLEPSGSPGADNVVCADIANAKGPTQRCLTINHIMIGGECADGPKPTINGGCEPGDYLVNGGCYTKDNKEQWICPNGAIYHVSQNSVPKYCPETIKYYEPEVISYKCENNYELIDGKCVKELREPPLHEKTCEEGYELKYDRCVNGCDTTDYIGGYVCEDDRARIDGKECVLYDFKDAKHS